MESACVLGWGRTTEGQLGLGGIEETSISEPRSLKSLQDGRIRVQQIACGHAHTLLLTEEGRVLSCGSNEKGQCGQDTSLTRPALITSLSSVAHVSCGHSHSLALAVNGQLYAWGNNEHGQLGVPSSLHSHVGQPQIVESLSWGRVLQVACGGHHNLVLMESGRVYSWGSNVHGQLGHNAAVINISTPEEVVSLLGLPILHLAAGDAHSMVVSRSGAVYGWGKNTFGQLGVGHERDTREPTELTTLRTQGVRYISCGERHSAALTEDGGLFTFGSSSFGQLGHNASSSHSTTYPTKVFELMGSTVIQVACGRCHTLAVVRSSGRVYGFGLGSSGQLGTGSVKNTPVPTLVQGHWMNRERLQQTLVESQMDTGEDTTSPGVVVREVFAGGDQSFASLVMPGQEERYAVVSDHRCKQPSSMPHSIDYEVVKKLLDEALITKDYSRATRFLCKIFSNPALLNSSFLSCDHHFKNVHTRSTGVDIDEAVRTMALLRQRIAQGAAEMLTSLQSTIVDMLKQTSTHRFLSSECIRLYLILPAFILQPLNTKLFSAFAYNVTCLAAEWRALVGQWLYNSPLSYLKLWLNSAKQSLSQALQSKKSEASQNKYPIGQLSTPMQKQSRVELRCLLELLKCIYEWNTHHGEVLTYSDFYVPTVSQVVNFVDDFFKWINPKEHADVVYCQYSFVMDTMAKAELLKIESKVQMHIAVNNAHSSLMQGLLFQQMVLDHSPLAFKLIVERDNLVQDTLNHLVSTEPYNYKKPLQVEFVGEEGMDAGGVQKEFFMLLLKDILDPSFGMFQEDEESKLIWFCSEALLYGSLNYFKLIGIVCGLAIYNSVIIDLPFPTALYKKLLKQPTDLSDLKQLYPSVGSNLESLLTYQGTDFHDTFSLTFEITRSSFGEVVTVPLVPGGSSKPVTLENRTEYVNAYIKYVLDDAVSEPFMAFDEGFRRVCDGKVLALLHPLELMSLVVGQQVIEWTELEKYMDYKNGYHKDHPVIRLFWTVFYTLPLEAKKKFLVFWTGCNRIPVSGVESMKMIIQRMDGGRDCERLPVAHTCFNVLDLPPYPSQELMKQKLLQAIHFTSGFGIV